MPPFPQKQIDLIYDLLRQFIEGTFEWIVLNGG